MPDELPDVLKRANARAAAWWAQRLADGTAWDQPSHGLPEAPRGVVGQRINQRSPWFLEWAQSQFKEEGQE